MKNRMDLWIGVALLIFNVTLLALPKQLEAQRAAGVSRVGWLEVCGPGPRRPHFDIFRARLVWSLNRSSRPTTPLMGGWRCRAVWGRCQL